METGRSSAASGHDDKDSRHFMMVLELEDLEATRSEAALTDVRQTGLVDESDSDFRVKSPSLNSGIVCCHNDLPIPS